MTDQTIDLTVIERFEAAWRAGRAEAIEGHLPPDDDPRYLATLEELVHVEMVLAWQAWSRTAGASEPSAKEATLERPTSVESYLARFPRLNRPEVVLRLVVEECASRRQCGEEATIEDYRGRFPDVVPDERQFEASLAQTLGSRGGGRLAETHATGMPGGTSDSARPSGAFGNYELLDELGRGGMGVVYRARQLTAERIVALKVIRRDRLEQLPMDTYSKAMDRFRHEAQAAARLDHENIVTVYEVGQVDEQPFFSMRYVEGRSLSEMLRDGPIENRRAAAYVEPVARAVHEAHCHGILHRDLKPQNILVDAKTDRPLVADFGLAKLSEGGDEITRAGEVMGTPSYMSPEQAMDSAAVDVQTDVYALGATLYHMLTARPPFQAATPVETLRQVIDEEPVPPRRLNPSIDRDLETVCLRCLQKEPTRRYDSALALADDLRRYVRGEPILARPIGLPGRLWRWCRRKPALATAVALAATFFVLAFVGTGIGYLRASAARKQAEESFQQAKAAVDDFLTLVGEETLLDEPGMQPLRRKLLVKARDYYQQFLEQRGDDPTIRDAVGVAHYRVGLATEKIDSPEAALASYRRARDLQRELVAQRPGDLACLQNLGNTWTAIGTALSRQGKLDEARAAQLEAIAVRQRAVELATADTTAADDTESARTLANSRMNLGIIEMNLGLIARDESERTAHFDEARRQLDEAQAGREEVLRDENARKGEDAHASEAAAKTRRDLAKGHFNLACLAMARLEADSAERDLDRAVAGFADLLDKDPKALANQSDLATCHRLLGDLKSGLGDAEAARRSYRAALELIDGLVLANPAVPSYRAALASLYMNVGQLEREQRQLAAAREAFAQARALLAPLVDGYPAMPDYREKLAATLSETARLARAAGETTAADDALLRAQEEYARLVREFPDNVEYQQRLAETTAAQGGE